MKSLVSPQPGGNAPALDFDTRKLVKKHMEDPNHVITEAELQRVIITTEHINLSEHPIVKAVSR